MERKSLEPVRALERVRIEAIHKNDADAMNEIIDGKFIYRVGPAKLNSTLSVDLAFEGEDIACGNWSKHLQKTPHALGSIQARGGAGLRSG